ncbi:hypothetical protein X801_09040 [Opisthorchis viverrini]|uniref:Uncharacterized protein n=1 Tax=Opisthorchis viverrini TaxID=6198 RepID=A0A1S8WL45_OPIVI|nr:hypothetical protein X801_09040 [Opisthorchis viverrini]
MDKKERFLVSITQRRTQSLLENYEAYTRENLISRLETSTGKEQLTYTDPGLFVCDQSFSVITGIPARYALAVSDYTSQTLVSKSDAPNSPSVLRPINSPEINCSRSYQSEDLSCSVELARLASCKRLTTLLDMNFATDKASLEHRIELLSRWLQEENLSEVTRYIDAEFLSGFSITVILIQPSRVISTCSALSDVGDDLEEDEEHLEALKGQYAKLAGELAYLDTLEIKQAQMDVKRTRQKQYIDRLQKILDAVAFENAWLRLITDLVQLEADSCQKLSVKLKATQNITESLLSDFEKLLVLFSSFSRSTSQVERDSLARLTASQHFENAVREILRNCSSPQLLQRLNDSTNSEELLVLLDELKSELAQDEASCHSSSNLMLSHSQRLIEQFMSLTEALSLPSTLEPDFGRSQPHSERVSGDRLRETFTGLCASDVVDFFTAACSHLDQLANELNSLREQANLAFSL